MYLAKLVIPLSACALAAATLGCTVGVDDDVGPPVTTAAAGTLTVRWLVGGTTDPSLCDSFRATALELVVYDAAGNQVSTTNAPCGSFSLTLPLPDGTYSADVTLVDPAGNSRSVTKPLSAVEIVTGTDLAIDVDFPSNSIL